MQAYREYEISESKLMIKELKLPVRIGQKFCVSCMRWMQDQGGQNKVSQDKLTFRWICNKCVEEENGKVSDK